MHDSAAPRRSGRPRTARALAALLIAVVAACSDGPVGPRTPTELTVPPITREFRGMWIATVANIDWPQTAGLSASVQQQQLTQLLDIAQLTGINAVILQVRAAGDALYPSTLEPWARSLMGAQGVDPGYDPLQFAINEAHRRGMELHAWFNPFRAANLSDTAALAANHFARRRPDLTRVHCTQLWFDPGEPAVHDHALAVIRDVVQRYEVDAVHIDDFFYPYPNGTCPGLDFADSATYARYQDAGGVLSRADWRRDNVNRFVQAMYTEVHAAESGVRVGVSPFGIWRPGNPAGITGLDAYATIYADSRHWLQSGWVDYLAPQLYWSIASTGQSFPALLGWWRQQNSLRRHFWPGLASYRTADGTGSAFANGEIPAQVTLARAQAIETGGATGTILYNASSVRSDRGGFATALATGLYAEPAIPPATTWLDAVAPAEPTVTVTGTPGALAIRPAGVPDAYWWLVRWRANGEWGQRLVRANVPSIALNAMGVDGIVVNAIDQVGNASPPVVWRP